MSEKKSYISEQERVDKLLREIEEMQLSRNPSEEKLQQLETELEEVLQLLIQKIDNIGKD